MKNATGERTDSIEGDEGEIKSVKLTEDELELMALKHRGFNNQKVKYKLDLTDKKFDALKRGIFYKLNANNWLNALRKLHRLNCLKQPRKN